MRSFVVGAVSAGVLLGPSFVLAGPPPATVDYPTVCRRSVEILQWRPEKGPPARFVADAYRARTATALWIGLGSTKTGFWSVQGGDENDACDDCQVLDLVETRFDGTRKVHRLLGAKDPTTKSAQHARVLATLWALAAKGVWSPAALDTGFVATPGVSAGGSNPPFAVSVASKAPHPRVVYDLRATTSMCWCVYGFSSRLAP